MVELWHEWNSVHSFKVRVALHEKRIDWFDRTVELLRFEHLTPAYLKLNPHGVVPTLVHDGKPVFDSSVICQYLDEIHAPQTLLPATALGRAHARGWLKFFDDVAHPAIRKASFELLYRPHLARLPPDELRERLALHPDPVRAQAFLRPADPGAVDEAFKVFERIVQQIEDALQDAGWLGGDAFGMADVAMAPFVERLDTLERNDLWTQPRSRDWAQRMMARPSLVASRAPQHFRMAALR